MPTSLLVQALTAASAVALGFAFWKGGPAERWAAACVAVNMLAAILLAEALGRVDGMIRFANDGLTALALLAVTVRYAAPWMIGVMFFYAVQFAMHAYYMVMGRDDSDYLHALINNVDFAGVIACLVVGTAVAWRGRTKVAQPSAT